MPEFSFAPYELPPEAKALRGEVRAFLSETLAGKPSVERARSWSGGSREFSRKLGARGWIGMTWPKKYGGHERSYAERYVVIEELLVAGAPVGSHWVADRQSGPLLLRFGTEEQRQTLLPVIARGELCFCIGMSEPGSGSDLASVRTRGRRVDGGWKVSGQKIWTSNARHADWMIALVRTGDAEQRHAGLSQLLVDMKSPGLTVKPAVAAAVVKDLGTTLEQDIPRAVQALAPEGADEVFQRTLTYLLQTSPSFSLRGGTREILRGIIAREMGLR